MLFLRKVSEAEKQLICGKVNKKNPNPIPSAEKSGKIEFYASTQASTLLDILYILPL